MHHALRTTLLRAISGVQPIASGAVIFEGETVNRMPAHVRMVRGIAQVPEGRRHHPAGGAECGRRPRHRRPRLCAGTGHRARRQRAADLARDPRVRDAYFAV